MMHVLNYNLYDDDTIHLWKPALVNFLELKLWNSYDVIDLCNKVMINIKLINGQYKLYLYNIKHIVYITLKYDMFDAPNDASNVSNDVSNVSNDASNDTRDDLLNNILDTTQNAASNAAQNAAPNDIYNMTITFFDYYLDYLDLYCEENIKCSLRILL